MARMIDRIRDHIPTKRRLIQLYSALLYNAHLRGFITGKIYTGSLKAVCVPGMNCYSCPGATGACPLGALQASLASSGRQAGFYIVGIFLLYGLIAGRTICGFLCPLGLIQELLHKIPTPKIRKSRVTRALSYLKYVFLAIFVFGITLWYGLTRSMAVPAFCKFICPAGTFEGAVPLISNPGNTRYFSMLGILFTGKFIIMLVIGLACVFCYRSFCRFLCPLGALYGMFSQLSLIGVKVDLNRCNGCGSCVRNCKMDVRRVGDHECIHCGQCISVCAQNALSMKAGRVMLMSPSGAGKAEDSAVLQRRKRIEKSAWTVALTVLAAVMIWVNVLESPAAGETAGGREVSAAVAEDFESSAPVGYNVGEQLADFTATCLDGTTFHLKEERGRIVIINLWATWCGPCVSELSYFDAFYREHKDDVTVLACHSSSVTDDVEEFLADKEWELAFTVDDDENGIFKKTDGSVVLPQTIVLNRRGEVIYNKIGSVTPKMLKKLYKNAASGEIPDISFSVKGKDETGEKDTDIKEDAEEDSYGADGSAATPNGQQEYRVYVKDADGKPVEGATVQICDDSACRIEDTDESGLAVFQVDKTEYDVHILRVPGGYAENSEIFRFPAEYSDMTITLEKDL